MKKGRPTKLTPEALRAFEKVIKDNVLFCTDAELVWLVNDQLPEASRFSYEAFSKWKRGKRQSDNVFYTDFVRLIKKALIAEKITLLKTLKSGTDNWQSRAWILERKFDEWNIKNKAHVDVDLNIENFSDDQLTAILKRLIK